MFKKCLIWIGWLGGCFAVGFFGTKAFMKAAEWVTEKLDECE